MNGRDTINLTDCDGKQGHWIIKKFVVLNPNSKPEMVKVEEGLYKDNKKEGLWKKFSKSGQLTDSVNYRNDVVISGEGNP